MEFTKLDIFTDSVGLEPLMAELTALGASGFEVHDAADFEEFLNSGIKHWDYVGEELEPLKTQETHLTLYLTKDAQGAELRGRILEHCTDLRVEESAVCEEDWADGWKEYFKPFEVGERLLIKPTWEQISQTDRLVLEIDPASAFGTGQHETTKLCLELLEREIAPDCTFLDLGCGSGILTVAALLLGAGRAVMVDISENAVRVAAENVTQNGFGADKILALCGDVTGGLKIDESYDVVVANIVADVLINMSASGIFPQLLRENGVLIASGIIEERLDEVAESLGSQLKIKEIKKDNGWCAVKAAH
jgi:ribosomal protein L11 methyltransferase